MFCPLSILLLTWFTRCHNSRTTWERCPHPYSALVWLCHSPLSVVGDRRNHQPHFGLWFTHGNPGHRLRCTRHRLTIPVASIQRPSVLTCSRRFHVNDCGHISAP